ncbi:MAG: DUF4440 domain-containing protein [Gemmatimonadaceae bacterium]
MRNNLHYIKRAAVAITIAFSASTAVAQNPTANRAALLAADRAFATSSASTDLVSGITAMLADSVTMIALGELFHGVPAAREALGRNPDNAKSTYKWTPLQGDVSNDGQVGYTMGFTSWKKPDGTEVPGKYVAFWTKQRGAWKVLVYKRVARAAGDVATAEEAAPVKPVIKNASYSSADSIRFAKELDAAERAFSDESAVIGLGKAFTKNSAFDAHHTGGGNDADFRRGPADIGAGISAGGEPPLGSINWKPEVVHVARSGDVGITFGYINIASPGAPARRVSYLTVWKRNGVTDPWKLAIE